MRIQIIRKKYVGLYSLPDSFFSTKQLFNRIIFNCSKKPSVHALIVSQSVSERNNWQDDFNRETTWKRGICYDFAYLFGLAMNKAFHYNSMLGLENFFQLLYISWDEWKFGKLRALQQKTFLAFLIYCFFKRPSRQCLLL